MEATASLRSRPCPVLGEEVMLCDSSLLLLVVEKRVMLCMLWYAINCWVDARALLRRREVDLMLRTRICYKIYPYPYFRNDPSHPQPYCLDAPSWPGRKSASLLDWAGRSTSALQVEKKKSADEHELGRLHFHSHSTTTSLSIDEWHHHHFLVLPSLFLGLSSWECSGLSSPLPALIVMLGFLFLALCSSE